MLDTLRHARRRRQKAWTRPKTLATPVAPFSLWGRHKTGNIPPTLSAPTATPPSGPDAAASPESGGPKPFLIHRVIETGQREIPWSSAFVLALVWFTWGIHMFAGGMGLTFTVRRYAEDPRIISIIMTLNIIVMLSPFISYMSDQVWTRAGRRRPFVLVAWIAGAFGMFGFAFLEELRALLAPLAGWTGLPITEFGLLIAIVVAYTTLYDFSAPLEPLFLECVPPHQRGRFFAMRGMLLNVAALFFYQVMWPVFDQPVDLFEWLGRPGLVATGERLIYILAGTLFTITTLVLVFNVREVHPANAPNKRFRDLGVAKFAVSYVKDVFLTKECYPFFIILVIPGLEAAVWGSFGALMQNDQFGYTKANQALWGLPGMLISMFLLTPLSGFYSDARHGVRKRWRWLLAAGVVAGAWGATAMYYAHEPADIRQLPPVWTCICMNMLVAVASGSFLVLVIESILDRTGRAHRRAWASLVATVFSLVSVSIMFLLTRLSEGQIPAITRWMMFAQIGGAFSALLGTFIGPMIYEYMPRNKMGTINAGKGMIDAILKFGVANLGAAWVVFYSQHIWRPQHTSYDYTSLYILQLCLFVPALACKIWFVRQVTTGAIPPLGILEVEGKDGLIKNGDAAETKSP